MTSLTAAGRLLTADRATRVLRYQLLPFGEPGHTSLGTVTATAGAIAIPTEPIKFNREHDRTRPLGSSLELVETPTGLEAAFLVARTRDGDDLLEEAAAGLRTGASIEVDNPVIRAGQLISGQLVGAAAVVDPAFPSARLVAADCGDETTPPTDPDADEDDTDDDSTEPFPEPSPAPAQPSSTEQDDPTTTQETTPMTAAATVAPGTLAATAAAPTLTAGPSLDTVFAQLAAAHQSGGAGQLLAALSDIVPANTVALEQPQWVGELWSGRAYRRRFIPLFNHAPLTSYKVRGWRWVTKPQVAPYAGNKAAIPSNAVLTEQLDIIAERIAGGHDIDRKHKDFNDAEFWRAYWAAMTESYARVSDTQVLADVLTAAGAAVPVGVVPAGVPRGLAMIVDGAIAILTDTDTMPTFAAVATGLWRDLLLTREQDKLAYLNAALGLDEGTLNPATFQLLPSAQLAAGQVLVGTRDAVTVHELGGESPIRVEAEHVSNAGIDAAVFGYYAVNVHDSDGLALVDDNVA